MPNMETANANRLINEKSPYLLQHAHNPVDWYPWGEEAFDRAQKEDKPVFLSIGYSTCHWCHVMARECFEDTEVAALLNEHFVSVKVDREERPDLDQIYMDACQALTGSGGWPLTVLLTPGKKPFFAGTYFPKRSRYGITGLMELLPRLASLWKGQREQAIEAGEQLLQAVAAQGRGGGGEALLGAEVLDAAYRRLRESFDEQYGGFGGAPKFPLPHRLSFLLRYWKRTGEVKALQMVAATLKSMVRGGIFDQLGYGFHRYSTDERWLVPHFEKMLYDQALLAITYLEAYQATGDEELAAAARAVFEYLLRDLRATEGGFCAAEDADTEGEEGLFYLWTPAEMAGVLGEERGRLVAEYFGVTERGNFERGRSILHRPYKHEQFAAAKGLDPLALQELIDDSRERLRAVRGRREPPFRDDKILAAWNGMAIAALARGAAVLEEARYAEAAASAAAFIREKMIAPGGRLLRRYRDGEAAVPAYLDDYACLAWGLLELYRATFNAAHLRWALTLSESMLELFAGPGGALQYAGIDRAEDLPPYADAYDGVIPSGNSVAALNLLKLGRLTGRQDWWERGETIIRAFSGDLGGSPAAFTFMLSALDFALGPSAELVITGEAGSAEVGKMAALVRRSFHPNIVLLFHPSGLEGEEVAALVPFIEPMTAPRGGAAAYLCR
ncbi:thioredoxin domain-containing protein, partial [Candidatus Darwinibacter acetoxidans]